MSYYKARAPEAEQLRFEKLSEKEIAKRCKNLIKKVLPAIKKIGTFHAETVSTAYHRTLTFGTPDTVGMIDELQELKDF